MASYWPSFPAAAELEGKCTAVNETGGLIGNRTSLCYIHPFDKSTLLATFYLDTGSVSYIATFGLVHEVYFTHTIVDIEKVVSSAG